MAHKRIFDVSLVRLVPETEEIEVLGVLQDLGGEPGVRRAEALVKIRYRGAFSEVQLVLDLNIKSVARPGLCHRLAGIPLAQGRIVNLCNERHDMEPG